MTWRKANPRYLCKLAEPRWQEHRGLLLVDEPEIATVFVGCEGSKRDARPINGRIALPGGTPGSVNQSICRIHAAGATCARGSTKQRGAAEWSRGTATKTKYSRWCRLGP